jgi:hypothetical protein
LVLVRATALGCATRFTDLPRSDAFRLAEFIAFPTPLRQICQSLFWFLPVQLRSDVQRLCADLPRSDALLPTEFVAIPTLLWHIRQLLFWFLSVQLRSAVHRLCADLRAV